MPIAGGEIGSKSRDRELYMHSDMQKISNKVRIMNMRDKAII